MPTRERSSPEWLREMDLPGYENPRIRRAQQSEALDRFLADQAPTAANLAAAMNAQGYQVSEAEVGAALARPVPHSLTLAGVGPSNQPISDPAKFQMQMMFSQVLANEAKARAEFSLKRRYVASPSPKPPSPKPGSV